MKKFFALCFLVLFIASPVMAHTTDRTILPSELVMFHLPTCGFCKAFHRDIGAKKFNASKRGKALPLRVMDMSTKENRSWVKAERKAKRIKDVRVIPTFIILYNGKEVGRITGYEGKDGFLKRLDAEVKRAFTELGGPQWLDGHDKSFMRR